MLPMPLTLLLSVKREVKGVCQVSEVGGGVRSFLRDSSTLDR